MKPFVKPLNTLLARCSPVLLLALGCYQLGVAAPMCEIDPLSHSVTVIQSDSGRGGIGGTGAPVRDVQSLLAASGSGGIGGTGAPQKAPLAGRVLFAYGTVMAERADGNKRPLAQGEPVCEGDAINTQQASMAQLNMADGGKIDIRAQSRLRIDSFTLPEKMDGSERFAASLAWGSVRAVTGQIGHVHKERYALHTPLADIGVRGTAHEVFHVPSALPDVPAGTYNRVLSGGTVLRSGGNALDLSPSQTGFVSFDGQQPRRLEHLPVALVQVSTLALATDWRKQTQNSPSDEPENPVYDKPLQVISLSFDMSAAAPEGSAYVGVSHDLSNNVTRAGGVISRQSNGSVIVVDPNWGLPFAAADTRNGFNFLVGDVTSLYDVGYATVDGVNVVWGLYGNANDVDPRTGVVRAIDFHHFAFSPQGVTSLPVLRGLSGTATFGQLVGASMLTDESGGIGGKVNSLKIGVQFGPQTRITSYQLNATDSQSRTWNANFSGAINLPNFRAGNLPLTVQCQGDGCGSGMGRGSAAGVVIGNVGKGVMTTYGLHTTTGQTTAGAALVTRP